MKVVGGNNQQQPRLPLRTFLLNYPLTGSNGNEAYPNEHLNPLPALTNLHVAYTIPPIRAFWYPLKVDTSVWDMCAIYAHESLHGYLSDTTVLGCYATLLTHFQYTAIMRALETYTPITIPALHEPTEILAKAQSALEEINRPMALVHELMATTLVRFWGDKGRAFMRPHFTALLSRIKFKVSARAATIGSLKGVAQIGSDSSIAEFRLTDIAPHLKDFDPARAHARFAGLNLGPKYTEVISAAEALWLRFYPELFPEYDFRALYKRLLGVWQQLDVGETGHINTSLHLSLCRYPFQISSALENISSPSTPPEFEAIRGHALQLKDEPLRRLDRLLTVIENAKPLHLRGYQAWEAYLKETLPDFAASLACDPLPFLYKNTHSIWHAFKHAPQSAALVAIGEIALSQLIPNEPTIILCALPVQNYDNQYRFANWDMDEKAANAVVDVDWKVPLMLEALRESILECRGVTCLCEPEVRDVCILRKWLELLWQLATPDPEYREWIVQHWQQPACMAVESLWNSNQIEVTIGQTRLGGDAPDKILTLAAHGRSLSAKANFPYYGRSVTPHDPQQNPGET